MNFLLSLLLLCFAGVATAGDASPLADLARSPRMHVGVVSIPLYGHFMPLKAAGEALLARGHAVTLFVENPAWCVSALEQQFRCVQIPASNRFTPDLFVNMSAHPNVGDSFMEIFDEMFRHHAEQLGPLIDMASKIHAATPFSLLMVDLSSFVGYGIADKLKVPYVSMFPLTMHMVLGPATYLPAIGTAFPANGRMSTGQRLLNYLLKLAILATSGKLLGQVNAVRVSHGIAPMRHAMELAGLNGLIFSPTIWGYDIAQPLCPNIFGVGVLSPTHDHTPVEPELSEFLRSCAAAIYVNFGTLAVLHDATFAALLAGLIQVAMDGRCVVWKIREASRLAEARSKAQALGLDGRFFLAQRFTNPVAVMQDPSTKVFVSHCGDTSVLEAIESNLPIAGIPIFADQADVCQRVDESGIGIYVGHKLEFSPERLARVLSTIIESPDSYRQSLGKMKTISDFLGGSAKVADVIESRYYNGLIHGEDLFERCHVLAEGLVAVEGNQWRLSQMDATVGYVVGLVAAFWILRLTVCWCFGPKGKERR